MKICVVGGTGNISGSFVKRLLEQGHEVTLFNRGSGRPAPEGARVILGNREDQVSFEARLQAEKFDAAIDMICFTPEEARSSLRAFRDVGHFIMCSTVCTYGIQYDWLPATEDHPLRPITGYARDKAAADAVFLEAHYATGFPVTIIKPSTTYGPIQGLTRQIAWDFSWIDRIRKGKPIVVCGDGNALHQHLHVEDAALAFANIPGKQHTIGQVYNLVDRAYTTWSDYHRAAMRVIGREVDLIGIPLADLRKMDIPDFDICEEIFAHHVFYSPDKLFRDVPEFRPNISLEEGMLDVLATMDREGRVPDSDQLDWEDRVITAHGRMHLN